MSSTLKDFLFERSKQLPNKVAFVFLHQSGAKDSITYAELADLACRYAAILQTKTSPGDRVIIAIPPSIDFVVWFHAVIVAGLVAVPYFPAINASIMENTFKIMQNCDSKLLITTKKIILSTKLQNTLSKVPILAWLSRKIFKLHSEEFDKVELLNKWHAFEDLKKHQTAENFKHVSIKPDDLAMLQYTSGSTGHPKGVCLSHKNIVQQLKLLRKSNDCNEKDVFLSWLPPYHDLGLFSVILLNMHIGAQAILMSPLSFLKHPTSWLQRISEYKVTLSGGPAFAYALAIKKCPEKLLKQIDLSSWRVAYCGGDIIKPEVFEQFSKKFSACGFRSTSLCPAYGLAENTLGISIGYHDDEPQFLALCKQSLSLGKVVLENTMDAVRVTGVGQLLQRAVVVNPKSDTLAQPDEIGEIWTQGDCVGMGYYNLPELSNLTFKAKLSGHKGEFLRTGDLGFMHNDEIYITGRIKDIVIVNGQNFYPHDIEDTAIQLCPLLRPGCLTFFQCDPPNQNECVLIAEVKKKFNYDQICTQLHDLISNQYGISISKIVLVKARSLPKTTSGKMQRAKCKQLWQTGLISPLFKWDNFRSN